MKRTQIYYKFYRDNAGKMDFRPMFDPPEPNDPAAFPLIQAAAMAGRSEITLLKMFRGTFSGFQIADMITGTPFSAMASADMIRLQTIQARARKLQADILELAKDLPPAIGRAVELCKYPLQLIDGDLSEVARTHTPAIKVREKRIAC